MALGRIDLELNQIGKLEFAVSRKGWRAKLSIFPILSNRDAAASGLDQSAVIVSPSKWTGGKLERIFGFC